MPHSMQHAKGRLARGEDSVKTLPHVSDLCAKMNTFYNKHSDSSMDKATLFSYETQIMTIVIMAIELVKDQERARPFFDRDRQT